MGSPEENFGDLILEEEDDDVFCTKCGMTVDDAYDPSVEICPCCGVCEYCCSHNSED